MSKNEDAKLSAPVLRANENIPEKFQAARTKLARSRPYINRPLWAMPVFVTEAALGPSGEPTLGVDRWWRLYAHPNYIDLCTVDQLGTTLYHEIGHLLQDYAARADHICTSMFERAIANIAGDMSINGPMIKERDSAEKKPHAMAIEFPKDYGVTPKDAQKFGCPKPLPDGWTMESYFDEIMKHLPKQNGGQGQGKGKGKGTPIKGPDCGSGADGMPRPYELPGPEPGKKKREDNDGLSPAEQELVRQGVAQDIIEHAKQHGRGTVPAHLLVWAEERFDPRVPWERVLRALVRRCLGAETLGHKVPSFKRPSRRIAVLRNVLLPTRWTPSPIVDVTIDTSGSMGADKRLAKALSEVDGLLTQVNAKVFVRSCDAAATAAKRSMKRLNSSQLVGGGGTDMRIGIQAGVEAQPRPHLLVCVSDGETPWPDREPPMPLVIILVGDKDAMRNVPSWAHTVFVDTE